MSSLIELKDINKYYGTDKEKLHVLKSLNMEIEQGEFLMIMGKSGSGKTTLMNSLGFLDRFDDGVYLFNNEEVTHIDENKKSELRNKYMGIMVGINTVIKDNPRLTCRLEGGRSPIRIVVDSNLRIPKDSNIVKTANKVKTIVATTKGASKAKILDLKNRNVEVIITENSDSKVNLNELMSKLYEKQIDGILLEGGGTLNYSALEEGIVDKVLFFIAPIIIGGTKSICPVSGDGINNLSCSNIGQDILIEGYIK